MATDTTVAQSEAADKVEALERRKYDLEAAISANLRAIDCMPDYRLADLSRLEARGVKLEKQLESVERELSDARLAALVEDMSRRIAAMERRLAALEAAR